MRRSASEIIRNLERRIARLEKSNFKTASSELPSFAMDQLLDEVYDETGIYFDESEVQDHNEKGLGFDGGVFLVTVGEFFAVVHIYTDDYPPSPSSDTVLVTKNRSEAFRKFKNFRG
tara:strand:- start:651 stop:1001 length:351 start_codon:yes stop_codon:yes gene_type:complete